MREEFGFSDEIGNRPHDPALGPVAVKKPLTSPKTGGWSLATILTVCL